MTNENNAVVVAEEKPLLDQFIARTRITTDESHTQESRDLIYDTVQGHLSSGAVNTRMLLISEMNDGSVKLDHVNIDHQKTYMEVDRFQVSNARAAYQRLAEGFDQAVARLDDGSMFIEG